FVDEGLSEDELDFICGMYKVYTEQGPDQQADRSWWPRYSMWQSSPYGVGYWTPKAERFFQGHLKDILAGKEPTKTSNRW
ncbi:hypothetical protein K474DRAFT_1581736, partial [Panus rudis PR-1116 ss-1]